MTQLLNCTVQHIKWLGDALCDRMGLYNTPNCNWDGGDCCPQSCLDTNIRSCLTNKFDCKNPIYTIPPTLSPTLSPTLYPTLSPTLYPTLSPTQFPTLSPTLYPTLSKPEILNSNDMDDSNLGLIIGIPVGFVFLLILSTLIYTLYCRNNRINDNENDNENNEP